MKHQNLEKEVLNCLITNPELLIKYSGTLKPELFIDENKLCYEEFLSTENINVFEFDKKYSINRDCDLQIYHSFYKCLLLLHEYRIRRELKVIIQTTNSELNTEDIFDVIENLQISISKLTDFSGIRSDSIKHINEHIKEVYDVIEKNQTSKETLGIQTGIEDIDRFTTGFHGGQLIVIAGTPGAGKTTFVLNVLRHVAVCQKKSICFFSFEMSAFDLTTRLISMETDINSKKIMRGIISTEDLININKKIHNLTESSIYLDEGINNKLEDILNRMRKYKQRFNIEAIIIDYMQLIKIINSENRYKEVSEIARSLKNISKELNIPIFAVSSLNRSVENFADKRPKLSSLRESGEIEYAADIVAFLYAPFIKEENNPERDLVEFIIEKGRNIGMRTIPIMYNRETSKFSKWENERNVF